MKRTLIASLLGMALVFSAAVVEAQKPKKEKAQKNNDKRFDFEADQVTGEIVKPDGLDSSVRVYKEHTSLIRVRQDFIREIVKSAEDL